MSGNVATGAPLLPYWLMFAVWTIGAVQTERGRGGNSQSRLLYFVGASVATTLMIGLRMYDDIFFLPLSEALRFTDPGYAALNWMAIKLGIGISFVNVICAALFMGGVARFAWHQPNPALAIVVAVPYLIIVVAMGYTRQAAAIGIICYAIADASERRLVRLIALISLAALL